MSRPDTPNPPTPQTASERGKPTPSIRPAEEVPDECPKAPPLCTRCGSPLRGEFCGHCGARRCVLCGDG